MANNRRIPGPRRGFFSHPWDAMKSAFTSWKRMIKSLYTSTAVVGYLVTALSVLAVVATVAVVIVACTNPISLIPLFACIGAAAAGLFGAPAVLGTACWVAKGILKGLWKGVCAAGRGIFGLITRCFSPAPPTDEGDDGPGFGPNYGISNTTTINKSLNTTDNHNPSNSLVRQKKNKGDLSDKPTTVKSNKQSINGLNENMDKVVCIDDKLRHCNVSENSFKM